MPKKRKTNQFIFLGFSFIPISLFINYFAFNTMLVFIIIHSLIIIITLKKKGLFKKTAIFSFFTSLILTPIIQHLAFYDKSWFVPSMIPRFLPEFSLEDFVSVFLMVYGIVALYEYFCDREIKLKFPKKYYGETLYSVFALVVLLLFRVIYDLQISIPYFYLMLMFVAVTYVFTCFYFYPFLIKRTLIVSLITLPLYLTAEYFSVLGGAWIFPGTNFVGHVGLFRAVFPIEELFFLIFSVPAIICSYELTADDRK